MDLHSKEMERLDSILKAPRRLVMYQCPRQMEKAALCNSSDLCAAHELGICVIDNQPCPCAGVWPVVWDSAPRAEWSD